MNPQLTYILAQEHIAELHRTGRCWRLAKEAATERRNSCKCNPITRLGGRLACLTARLVPSLP